MCRCAFTNLIPINTATAHARPPPLHSIKPSGEGASPWRGDRQAPLQRDGGHAPARAICGGAHPDTRAPFTPAPHLSAARLDHELARQMLRRLRLERPDNNRPVQRVTGDDL
eukprot:m.85666 g.85666  ORF g.85666 m.85666 type:complete len:112 (-) comp8249_c0_seq1:162-497(-)